MHHQLHHLSISYFPHNYNLWKFKCNVNRQLSFSSFSQSSPFSVFPFSFPVTPCILVALSPWLLWKKKQNIMYWTVKLISKSKNRFYIVYFTYSISKFLFIFHAIHFIYFNSFCKKRKQSQSKFPYNIQYRQVGLILFLILWGFVADCKSKVIKQVSH